MDNDFVTWRNYSNRFWPAKYLIDMTGEVRHTHFGEGRYAETEEKIRELLLEAGAEFIDGGMSLPSDQTVDATYLNERGAEVTRELYGGYERGYNDYLYGRGGYVQQQAYYNAPNQVVEFESPGDLVPHQLYFDGPRLVGPESIKHARETSGYQDSMYLIYSAVSVNAVLTSDSGEDYKVRVTVDGEYLTEENKGADITIGSDGESYIMVTGSRLYEVLANPQYQRRQHLTMSSNSMDFGFFPSPSTFTRSAPDAFLGFARQLSSSFTGTHRHVGRDPRRSHLAGGYLVFRRPKWFHGGPGARVSGHSQVAQL